MFKYLEKVFRLRNSDLQTCACHAVPRRQMGLVTRQFERKKFYRHVSVYSGKEGNYGIKLDHRILHTPFRCPFLVPSELLALAVAEEWNSQREVIQSSFMHLSALCNRVLDAGCNQMSGGFTQKEGYGHSTEDVSSLMNYLTTDTLCFRATDQEDLVARQDLEWNPIVKWFNERFQCEVPVIYNCFPSASSRSSIPALASFIAHMNRWALEGFKSCVHSCSSLVVACALYDQYIDSEKACALARLENRHQATRWGEVEWHHSVEESDLRSRLAAAVVLKELTMN